MLFSGSTYIPHLFDPHVLLLYWATNPLPFHTLEYWRGYSLTPVTVLSAEQLVINTSRKLPIVGPLIKRFVMEVVPVCLQS